MRRLANIPGITITLYLVWKLALLLFTSQPVPANDSFFYDGPVVNYLLHGRYCNPSLAVVLPISGNEVFCAYPPLYQFVLMGWMKCFGTSVLAAMWLHVTLLCIFALTVQRIFRVLEIPALAANIAGLFLFGITFHDRPDTLAHVLAMLAVLAVVHDLAWVAAAFLVLTFTTSFQIGGIYALWIALFLLSENQFNQRRIPWAALLTFVGVLTSLVALVKFGHPRWWEGFREHVAITPSVTGLRFPSFGDLAKLVRNSPGTLLVMTTLAALTVTGRDFVSRLAGSLQLRLVVSGTLAATALMGGCLFCLSPNTIHLGTYLQPVLVGGLLATVATRDWIDLKWRRVLHGMFLAAVLLVSVRAIGISTWGVLCAGDVSRSEAMARINQDLDTVPAGGKVFVSAAYLYETARRTNITWLHSDWVAPASKTDWERGAIELHHPAKMLLTQFDYHRRYEPILSLLQRDRADVEIRITDLARVSSPEALPATRKVIQYISWAPVIVEFEWPHTVESK